VVDARPSVSARKERVYAVTLGGTVHAFNRGGTALWTLDLGAPIQATPVLDGEGTMFFGAQDGRLYAITRRGEVRWRLDLPASIDSSAAITGAGRLVFGADDGMLRAVADTTAPLDW
jgi:outer membrane protein assembly factor BamB